MRCIIAHMMRVPATLGFGAFLAVLLEDSGPRGRCGRALQMGLQLKRQGKPGGAGWMKNAVRCVRTTRGWFTLGRYRMEGELDNAGQALLKVTKLQPDDASAHANLGAIYGRQKNGRGHHGAGASGEPAAGRLRSPCQPGRSLAADWRLPERIPHLRKATELKPKEPLAWSNLGVALSRPTIGRGRWWH